MHDSRTQSDATRLAHLSQQPAVLSQQLTRGSRRIVDPTPYFVKYGQNSWAAVKGCLDAVTDYAATPVISKYTGVLAA